MTDKGRDDDKDGEKVKETEGEERRVVRGRNVGEGKGGW